METILIELCDGKYTYIYDNEGQRVLRYGGKWRCLIGDGFVLAMAHRIEELEKVLIAAKRESVRHLNDQDYDTTCKFVRCELCQAIDTYKNNQRS